MKEILKKSLKLFAYLICAGLMCCFTYLSFNLIFSFAFTETAGYDVYGYADGSEQREYLYSVDYGTQGEDAEDLQWKQFEEKGYVLQKYNKRTELSSGLNTALVVLSQTFCLLFVLSFVVDQLLPFGNKDNNLVRINVKKEDKLKGLKIASFASVPAFLTFLLFVLGKFLYPKLPVLLYMVANGAYWPVLSAVFKGTATAGDIAFWQFAGMLLIQLIVPIAGFFAYFIGYKDYAVLSKLLYKKNKKG